MSPGLILGFAFVALFLPYPISWAVFSNCSDLCQREYSEIIKVVIPASLAVGNASFIWLLSLWLKVEETEKSKRNFRQALWTEIGSLYGTAFNEAQWWQNEMKDKSFGATEKRLIAHFQAGVLNANLSRIIDVKPEVADALIALRANLLVLPEKIEFFYDAEDRVIAEVKAGRITDKRAVEILSKNKHQIFQALMRLAACGRRCCLLLDSDGAFEAKRAKSFNKEAWAKRKESDDVMNEILDKLNKHIEENDAFSL